MVQFLSLIISPSLLAWLAFLWLLGVLLKHCTPFPNWGISGAILLAGATLGLLYGLAHPIYEIFAYIAQGIILALFAIGSYDMAHGIFKGVRTPKEGESNMKVKEFLKNLESLWLAMAVTLCAAVVTAIASIVIMGWNGLLGILDAATIAILISIFVLTINDIASKLEDKRYKLCWQYWVTIAMIFVSDVLFACAWRSSTFPQMFIMLGLTVAMGIGAIICYILLYKPAVKAKEDVMHKVLATYMERHNIPEIASTLMLCPDKDELKKILEEIFPKKEKTKKIQEEK